MISPQLLTRIQCPDCAGTVSRAGADRDAGTRTAAGTRRDGGARAAAGAVVTCERCGREFAADRGYLDLRPAAEFAEQTKYLDHDLHLDARHESIAPPVLGSKIRNDMLRKFLAPGPGDRVIDLGCGSGRAIAWNADSGAAISGVDISPFFAAEALEHSDLILGDLRRLPIRDAVFNKGWSLDVLEHLSPGALKDMLTEANRVLEPGGQLFIYTHVRKNGWPAVGVRWVNRLARVCERLGLIDLRQERLRKSDHLNPIADHDDLTRITGACGFRIARITYYSPITGAFVENILTRMAERWLSRRAARRTTGGHGAVQEKSGTAAAPADAGAAVRAARAAAQARVRRGGFTYRALVFITWIMKIDLVLFGRVPSGPFFALLEKTTAPATSKGSG